MLAAIGETFELPFVPAASKPAPPLAASVPNEITGVIVSSRKAFYRINIWTRTSALEDKARIENIGRQFKYSVLDMGEVKVSDKDKVNGGIEFVSHEDSQAKASHSSPPLVLHESFG